MTDSELIEHMHARGWRTEAIDVPMIREACKALQASASAEPVQIPEGWALVPVEPTPDMMCEAWDHTPVNMDDMTDGDFGQAYKDMIAASPPPVTAAREQEGQVPFEKAVGSEAGGTGARSSEWGRLYTTANAVVARIGCDGQIDSRADEVASLMDALHDLDGGQWMPGLMPATPTTSTTGKVDASRVRDEALSEAVGLYESEDVLAPVGNSAWGEAYQDGWIAGAQAYREAIRSLIGTPKSAEGEGA